MSANGAQADPQARGNLFAAFAARNAAQHLLLAFGQGCARYARYAWHDSGLPSRGWCQGEQPRHNVGLEQEFIPDRLMELQIMHAGNVRRQKQGCLSQSDYNDNQRRAKALTPAEMDASFTGLYEG